MDKKKKVLNTIVEQGILLFYYHANSEVSSEILRAIYRSGVRVLVYRNRGETAWKNFMQLRKISDKEFPDLLLGAGTIRNKIAATEFINEGADFLVSPGITEEVANLAHSNDLPWIPGCMTTTEIILADDLGANIIKLFPGNLLSPSYLSAVKEIFPHLLFMPSGGIEPSEESLNEWFAEGASAVAIGSKFFDKDLIESGDYTAIESLARNALKIIHKVSKSNIKKG